MVASCCAYNCSGRAGSGSSFHRFPKDPRLRRLWSGALRRENFQPNKHTRICSKHFTEDSYEPGMLASRKLKKYAVPTIFDFGCKYKVQKVKQKLSSRQCLMAASIDSSSDLSDDNVDDKDVEPDSEDIAKEVSENVLKSGSENENMDEDSLVSMEEDQDVAEILELGEKCKSYGVDFEVTADKIKDFYEVTSTKIRNQQNEIKVLRQNVCHLMKKIDGLKLLTDLLEVKDLISEEAAFVLKSTIT